MPPPTIPITTNRIAIKLPNRSNSPIPDSSTTFDMSLGPHDSPSSDPLPDDTPLPDFSRDTTLRSKYPTKVDDLSIRPSDNMPSGSLGVPTRRDIDLASPSSFQFPRPSKLDFQRDNPSPIPQTREFTSTPGTSTLTHQNALSLDVSSLPVRYDLSPPISRSRSATTPPPLSLTHPNLDEKTIPVIDVKKAVESIPYTPSFVRGAPGLKDVLKVTSLSPIVHFTFELIISDLDSFSVIWNPRRPSPAFSICSSKWRTLLPTRYLESSSCVRTEIIFRRIP